MLLKLIADRKVAEFGSVHLPLHGVTARPVSPGTGSDVERHANAIAGVETRASHLGEVPSRPEITRPPLRVGFETPTGKHHRAGA